MVQALVPARRRLDDISPRTWEHPADRAALALLRSLPGFDEALKKILGAIDERGARLAFQADSVRVTPRQFPHLHRIWLQAMDTLDAQEDYALYIAQSPFTNAGALGFDHPWVCLYSGSLRMLTEPEIEFVMGHELGHVISGHALYHTMMILLLQLLRAGTGPLLSMVSMPVLLALLEWSRKSELSADRAGLLAVQVPDAALGAFMRMAGGGTPEEMHLGEFLTQAEEYRDTGNLIDKVMKVFNTMGHSHPLLLPRALELREWLQAGEYDRVLAGEYPRRANGKAKLGDDLAAGVSHYAAGARDAAGRAGDTLKGVRDAFNRGFNGRTQPQGTNQP